MRCAHTRAPRHTGFWVPAGENGAMPLYRDEAIVLRTQKLGEADRIVTLLTRTHGKVRVVGKGVRRTKSRFGARLEPAMMVDLQCYEGRSLDTVTQAETLAQLGRRARSRLHHLHRRDRDARDRRPAHRGARAVGAAVPPARRRAALPGRGRPTTPAWSSTPTCCARWRSPAGRRASTTAPAAVPRARTARSTSPPAARCARSCRPPGSAAPAPETLELLAALLAGDWAVADASDVPAPPRGQRPGRRRSCSGTSSVGCARCGWSSA